MNGNAEKEEVRIKRIEEHEAIWPSEEFIYLWDWFVALSDWRDSSFGIGPLPHQEIESWARLMQLDPPISPFEVSILRKLDLECRYYFNEKNSEDDSDGAPIAKSLLEFKNG